MSISPVPTVLGHLVLTYVKTPTDCDLMLWPFVILMTSLVRWRSHHESTGRNKDHVPRFGIVGQTGVRISFP